MKFDVHHLNSPGEKRWKRAVSILFCIGMLCGSHTWLLPVDANEAGTDSVEPKSAKDNSSQLHIVQGADTADLIELNLYNYGSGSTGNNINDKYNQNPLLPGFQQSGGTVNIPSLTGFRSASYKNFGDIITSDLADGTKVTSLSRNPVGINRLRDMGNSPISRYSQVMYGTLLEGYPALKNGTSLGYLFGAEDYSRKVNSQSINGLFQYDGETGTYSFNSRENFAAFQQDSNSFTLYQEIFTPNFIMYPFGNFMPFNDIVTDAMQVSQIGEAYFQEQMQQAEYLYQQGGGAQYAQLAKVLSQFLTYAKQDGWGDDWTAQTVLEHYFDGSRELPGSGDDANNFNQISLDDLYSLDYDVASDFFFGMEMKLHFLQPAGGLTGQDGDGDGMLDSQTEFYFAGDDDVWVYIDGVLFLDLSGIHRHVAGKINFVDGTVSYYSLDTQTGDVAAEPYKIVRFSDLVEDSVLCSSGTFEDYSVHSLQLYYLERGAGSSVCQLHFNFPLLWKLDADVPADEIGSLDITNCRNAYDPLDTEDRQFLIYVTLDGELLPAGTSYIAGGEIRTVEADGCIPLKEGETASIVGIPAGTEFSVQEVPPLGYSVSYEGDELTQSENENGGYACGSIQAGGGTAVNVVNVEQGAVVFLPGSLTLLNPDDSTYSFCIRLEQTANRYGKAAAGQVLETTVTYPQKQDSNLADFLFSLSYLEKDLPSLPVTFYYRITQADNGDGTIYLDDSAFVAEITVDQGESGQILAALTGLYQNGAAVEAVHFTNSLVSADGTEVIILNTPENEPPQTSGALPFLLGGTILLAGSISLLHRKTRF